MLSTTVHAIRGGPGTPIPGPANPYTSRGVESFPQETSPTLVEEFATPSGIHAYAPDNRVSAGGLPIDFLGSVGDDQPTDNQPVPTTPAAWRKADTSNNQPIASADYNLRDENANAVNGWGFIRPPEEFLQIDGSLVQVAPTLFPDARYEGEIVPTGPANYQYQAWANPAPSSNAGDVPLTAITPYVTEF